jgi:hypothetical protein
MAGRVEPLKSPAPQPFPAAHLGQAADRSTATVALSGPIDTIFPIGASITSVILRDTEFECATKFIH